jgi:hypothetical protein
MTLLVVILKTVNLVMKNMLLCQIVVFILPNVIEGPLGSKTGLSCPSKRKFLDEIAESFVQ